MRSIVAYGTWVSGLAARDLAYWGWIFSVLDIVLDKDPGSGAKRCHGPRVTSRNLSNIGIWCWAKIIGEVLSESALWGIKKTQVILPCYSSSYLAVLTPHRLQSVKQQLRWFCGFQLLDLHLIHYISGDVTGHYLEYSHSKHWNHCATTTHTLNGSWKYCDWNPRITWIVPSPGQSVHFTYLFVFLWVWIWWLLWKPLSTKWLHTVEKYPECE